MAKSDGGDGEKSKATKRANGAGAPKVLPRGDDPGEPGDPFRTIVHEHGAARRRLRDLGLDYDPLLEVVKEGERNRVQATAHDPTPAGSWDAYRYRVRGLRDLFVPSPYGWTPDCIQGLELLRSPDGTRVIMTRTGDAAVGRSNGFPQPVRTFGEVTARAVSANESLLIDPDWLNVGATLPVGQETWILLVHPVGEGVARSELSRPSGTSASGRVDGWVERILLEEIDITEPERQERPDDQPALDDVESLVTRKR